MDTFGRVALEIGGAQRPVPTHLLRILCHPSQAVSSKRILHGPSIPPGLDSQSKIGRENKRAAHGRIMWSVTSLLFSTIWTAEASCFSQYECASA